MLWGEFYRVWTQISLSFQLYTIYKYKRQLVRKSSFGVSIMPDAFNIREEISLLTEVTYYLNKFFEVKVKESNPKCSN